MNSTKRTLALAICAGLSGAFSGVVPAQTGTGAPTERGGSAAPGTSSPATPGGAVGGLAVPASPASPAVAASYELKAARLSKLDGVNLYDSNAKKIGEVEDLVVDPASGRVLHALVSLGGVMGIGDKEYAVPTRELRVFSRAADDTVPIKAELGVPQEGLTSAKSPEKDSPYMMGSKLVGMDVNDGSGKEVGEIEDVIVDLQAGEARYALIEFEDSWAPDDRLFAFPLSELKRDKDGRNLTLNVTREALAGIPSIESTRLDKVDLSGTSWLQVSGASGTGGAGAPGQAPVGASGARN